MQFTLGILEDLQIILGEKSRIWDGLITPTNITDHNNITREFSEWPSFVKDGINRARQLAWKQAATSRPNYTGVEQGMDEFTTRKLYNFLAQNQPMNAGALHTIITNVVWYPQRANNTSKTSDGNCLLCSCKNAGLQHIWWEYEA